MPSSPPRSTVTVTTTNIAATTTTVTEESSSSPSSSSSSSFSTKAEDCVVDAPATADIAVAQNHDNDNAADITLPNEDQNCNDTNKCTNNNSSSQDDDDNASDDGGDGAWPCRKRQRRSQRNTNRIVLSDKSSLSYRRLQELFFQEDTALSTVSSAATTAAATSTTTVTFGNLTLQRVHNAPNIYVIDNFLRPMEIAYLRTKIQQGRFQRSYVDAVPTVAVAAVEAPVPAAVPPVENNDGNHHGNDLAVDQDNNKSNDSLSTDGSKKAKPKSTAVVDAVSTANSNTASHLSTQYDDQHRTSTFLSFTKQQDAKIAAIEQRAANLLGCWSSQCIEPLQLVRYKPGEFFGVHHDMGDLQEDGTVALPPRTTFGKRRLVTLFCYLNTLPQDETNSGQEETNHCHKKKKGSSSSNNKDKNCTSNSCSRNGATQFPAATNNNTIEDKSNQTTTTRHARNTRSQARMRQNQGAPQQEQPPPEGLLIQPVQGRAVLFCNVTPDGLPDARTIHAGLPPVLSPILPLLNGGAGGEVSEKKKKRGRQNSADHDSHHFEINKYGLNIWMCED